MRSSIWGVVGGNDDAALRCGEGARTRQPSAVRMGMFCRLGFVAGEAASNGDGLSVGSMHAAVFWGDHFGQFVGVGGFEFQPDCGFEDDFGQG